ncbi:hypothetical protein B4079_1669 [Bacillus cereus]|nr:hypothetical protein B4079_1669 [Bacillus cereus]
MIHKIKSISISNRLIMFPRCYIIVSYTLQKMRILLLEQVTSYVKITISVVEK